MNNYFISNNFRILQKHIDLFIIDINNKNYNPVNCSSTMDCNNCPFSVNKEQCLIENEFKLTEEQINILADSNPELFI